MTDTLIVEDEPAVRRELEWLIRQQADFNLIGSAANVEDAHKKIISLKPHLVLMDIQLGDGTAFDLLDRLEHVDFRIIFITAYSHFAIRSIKSGALDYLLKPLDEAELKLALKKATATVHNTGQQLAIAKMQLAGNGTGPESRIVLHTQDFLQVLQLKDIRYCKSDGSYTVFFLDDGRQAMVSRPLKYYDDLLPDAYFLRPHQSYLVNIAFIDKFLKSGSILLKDKTELPVSGRRRDYIIKRITSL